MGEGIIITIDGPAGTGKSTVARELARRLGLDFLDTGAMYRAATAIAIDRGLDPNDGADHAALVEAVASADLHFDWGADPPAILAWERPLGERIRGADVDALVSDVAAIAPIREHMVKKQRLIGRQHPRLVTEGRDQGSVVFPDAAVKFYLDARAEVRARRRAGQNRRGASEEEIRRVAGEIRRRDELDSTRPVGPLVCPDDAQRVDTSEMDFERVVAELERRVRAAVNFG